MRYRRGMAWFAFVLALLVLGGGIPSSPALGASAGVLRVLNWKGYGSSEPWVAAAFKAKYGIEIVHDYFNSNEELLTKLRTSPGTYDVVLPNNSYFEQAIKEGLIEPIDVSKIPNYQDDNPGLRALPEYHKDGKIYGVPWTWGATGLAYDTTKIKEPITSINAFWDPKFKGQVGWLDDYLNSVQFAAIALGQDPNNPSNLDAIKAKLKALKGQVRTFWTSSDQFNKLFAAKTFSVGVDWSGSAIRSQRFYKLPLAYVIPKEGAMGWVDAWAIPTKAPHQAAALTWINYIIGPDFFTPWDAKSGATTPANERSLRALPTPYSRKMFADPAVAKRLIFGKTLTEDQRNQFVKLWEEVKASLAP